MTTVTVLGSGIMATALSWPLSDNGHEVRLVGTHLDRDIIDSIKETGVHPNLDLKVPDGVRAYQLEEAEEAFEGADVAMSGVNSFGVHWAGEQFANLLKPGMMVIAVTKGMEADDEGNLSILPDVLASKAPEDLRNGVTWSAITGPAIAGEVAVRHDTCVVFTGLDADVLEKLAATFRTDYYHVWTSTDFVGCEVCAAVKNCYAFGGGFMDGLLDKEGASDAKYRRYNYGAALFGQATRELERWMELLGGQPETPRGLPGVGDMFVTTMGGRNVKAGRFVGAGVPFSEVRNDRMKGVTLEGVAAIGVIGSALEKLTERGVVGAGEFPLMRHMYDVVAKDEPLNMPWKKFFGSVKCEGRKEKYMNRESLLEHVEDRPFDVIVVGAGINGAGIARDASMRGLRVLMLDKGDISSGTTQWATRLIHGGLRYLEHYEVPLVRESLRDREILFHIAPHLVKPLKFTVPVYDRSSRGPGMIRLGMIGYDVLSFDKSVPNHRMLSREQTLAEYPGLNPDGLEAAATYYDGQVEYAERIAVENAMSAAQNGATVITYAEVKRLVFDHSGDRVVGVEFEDRLDGGGTYTVHASVTVNVAGPWVDRVLGGSGEVSVGTQENGDDGRMIGGTKGSHIIVDPFPGAPKNAVYVEARKDGRPYFIVPWNGRYMIGTTDLRYTDDLDYVSATEDEIQYLLDETNYVVPEAKLTRDSVLFTYSGVRPLPFAPEGSEGSISRSHVVYDHAKGKSAAGGRIKVSGGGSPRAEGLLSIVGGKLTTYRNLGRQTSNVIFKKLGVKGTKSATDRVPLPGGLTPDLDAFAADFKARSGLTDVLASRLLKLYGARSYDVLAESGDDSSLRMPLTTSTPAVENALLGCEVLYAFRHEMAQKLADVLLRRTMVSYDADVGIDVDEAAAEVAVKHLGWSEERARREVEEYREWIRRYTPRSLREETGAAR